MHADDPIGKLIKLTSSGYDPQLISQALRLLKVYTVKNLQGLDLEKLLHLSGLDQEQAEYLFLVVTKWLEVPLVQRHYRGQETQKNAPSGNEHNQPYLRKSPRQSSAQHAERLRTNESADESVEKLIKLTLFGYESLLLSQALQLLNIHTIKDLQGLQPERLLQLPALNQKRAARLFKILTQWMNHQLVRQRLFFPEKQKRDALPPTRPRRLAQRSLYPGRKQSALPSSRLQKLFRVRVEELKLSAWTKRNLRRLGVEYVGELTYNSESVRRCLRELDDRSLQEIKENFRDLGLTLPVIQKEMESAPYTSSHRDLLTNDTLSESISDTQWDEWRNTVHDSPVLRERLVREVAVATGSTWPSSRAREKLSDYCKYDLQGLKEIPGIGVAKRNALIAVFACAATQLVPHNEQIPFSAQSPPLPRQISHVEIPNEREIEQADISLPLAILSTRDREVITSRFGLDGNSPETLETIGLRFGITRERVRQLEARAIRRLREEKPRAQVQKFLLQHEQDLWRSFTGDQEAVSTSQVLARSKLLPGDMLLALTVLHDSPRNWMDTIAKQTPHGWYRGEFSLEDLVSWQQKIRKYCASSALPCPLISFITPLGLQEQQLTAAVTLMPDFYVFLGYLTDGKPTRRRLRCIRAHLMLSCECRSQPTLVEDLRDLYRKRYQDDQCTARDLEIVMTEAPHLFLKLHEAGWIALNTVIPFNPMLAANHQKLSEDILGEDSLGEIDEQETEEESNDGLVALIHRMLTREGPMALFPARQKFQELADGLYSPNSVFPTLITRTEFVRMAPGIFGTRAQLADIDPVHTVSSQLIRRSQCRIYVMAKAAGEPHIQYPLWTPAMEHAWCRWAEKEAPRDLFRSLLAIATPVQWPVSEGERSWWLKRKSMETFYALDADPPRLDEQLPELEEVFAVAMYAYAEGSVHWMAANRVTGHRIDAQQPLAAILALLVGADVLIPPKNWQGSHKIGSRAAHFLISLTTSICKTGVLDWSDEFRFLFQYNLDKELGWVKLHELNTLLQQLMSISSKAGVEQALSEQAKQKESVSMDSLDALLAKHRQGRLITRLQAELD